MAGVDGCNFRHVGCHGYGTSQLHDSYLLALDGSHGIYLVADPKCCRASAE